MATYTADSTNQQITIDLTDLEVQVLLDNYVDLQEAADTIGQRYAFKSALDFTLHRAQDSYREAYKAGDTDLPNLVDDEAVMSWWINSKYYPGTAAEREAEE